MQFEKSVDLILVEVKYLSQSQHTKCNFTWDTEDVMEDLKEYQNLNVARNVCINLQREISPTMFRSLVFGDLSPQNSLVIFKEWRGLGPGRIYKVYLTYHGHTAAVSCLGAGTGTSYTEPLCSHYRI